MLFSYLRWKIKARFNDLTPDRRPMIHILPKLWQKIFLRCVAKKLDSRAAQRQSYATM